MAIDTDDQKQGKQRHALVFTVASEQLLFALRHGFLHLKYQKSMTLTVLCQESRGSAVWLDIQLSSVAPAD